jgi:hypothetical protein
LEKKEDEIYIYQGFWESSFSKGPSRPFLNNIKIKSQNKKSGLILWDSGFENYQNSFLF